MTEKKAKWMQWAERLRPGDAVRVRRPDFAKERGCSLWAMEHLSRQGVVLRCYPTYVLLEMRSSERGPDGRRRRLYREAFRYWELAGKVEDEG